MFDVPTIFARRCGCLTLAACLATGGSAVAQVEPQRASDDSAARDRDEILESRDWRATLRAWDEWLAMQRRYDPKQVKKLKQQFKEKIQNMSPEELDEFRSDLDARLHILMGDEARDARRWLSDTLSVASDKYAKKVLADLPDVANLTSPELLSELDRFENRSAQTRQSVAATQQAQRDRTKSVQAQLREQRSASEKALDRAVQSSAAQGSNFVPSALHNRKSFSDRPNWVGVGFW